METLSVIVQFFIGLEVSQFVFVLSLFTLDGRVRQLKGRGNPHYITSCARIATNK